MFNQEGKSPAQEKSESVITPTEELDYALAELDKDDIEWGNIYENVLEFIKKFDDASVSDDEKELFKQAIEKIKSKAADADIPEEIDISFSEAIKNAEKALA